MPWANSWSGAGEVIASSVQVINNNAVVASINQQGVITGQSLSVSGDVNFQGGSLLQDLADIPGGIIAQMQIPPADLPTASFGATEAPLMELDVILAAGRQYGVYLTNIVYNNAAAPCRVAMWARYTLDGSQPTTASNGMFEVWKNTESIDGNYDIVPDHMVTLAVTTQTTLRLLITSANQPIGGAGQTSHRFIAAGSGTPGNVGVTLQIVDQGPTVPNTGIYLGGSGGTPTPVFKSFFTLATDSQSFTGNGTPSNGSGGNEQFMYYGEDPGYPNGNWGSWAWFNVNDTGGGAGGTNGLGTIADMHGVSAANVSFLKLWVYTAWWYYVAGGTLYLGYGNSPVNHSVEPAALGVRNFSVNYTARGQGQWINLMGTALGTAILNGTFNSILLGPGPTTDFQYYGYAAGVGFGSNVPAIWGGYYK